MNKMQVLYKYRLVIILVVVIAGFSLAVPQFLSVTTMTNVLWAVAMTGIMAAGEIYPILTGGIDLSIGTLAALTSCMLAWCMVNKGWPLGVAILFVLAFGAAAGFVNGSLVTRFKIPAFITTMAMMKIFHGLAMIWSEGKTMPIRSPQIFLQIAIFKVFGVALPVYIMLAMMLLSFWLLHRSSYGRRIIATGGNPIASELSGVKVNWITTAGYMFSSVCAVIGGIVLASMNQQGKATMADGYEMNAISAIVLGGASMAGGKGTIPGTLFGVVLIGLINCGMTMLNAPSSMHNIVRGLIIIATVALDSYISRSSIKTVKRKEKVAA